MHVRASVSTRVIGRFVQRSEAAGTQVSGRVTSPVLRYHHDTILWQVIVCILLSSIPSRLEPYEYGTRQVTMIIVTRPQLNITKLKL